MGLLPRGVDTRPRVKAGPGLALLQASPDKALADLKPARE
jgi:hypothetical protein